MLVHVVQQLKQNCCTIENLKVNWHLFYGDWCSAQTYWVVRDCETHYMPSMCLIACLVSIIDIIHQRDEIKSVDISFMHAMFLLQAQHDEIRMHPKKKQCEINTVSGHRFLSSSLPMIYFCCRKFTFFDFFMSVRSLYAVCWLFGSVDRIAYSHIYCMLTSCYWIKAIAVLPILNTIKIRSSYRCIWYLQYTSCHT